MRSFFGSLTALRTRAIGRLWMSQLRVVYGSQTGTAQMFAGQLADLAREKQWEVAVSSLDDDPECVEAENLVVVTSVFGEGEPPDNAKRFYRSLMDSHGTTLAGRYATFALGDSRYARERFAIVGLNIDRELEQRGKQRIMPVSVGDAAGDIEQEFDEFAHELLEKLGVGDAEKREVQPDRLVLVSGAKEPTLYAPLEKNALALSCVTNRSALPLSTWTERPCALLELSCPELQYQTGDYLGVYPQSNSKHVENLVQLLRLDKTARFSIESGFETALSARSKSFPNPVSVETFLSKYCDLQRPLQTSTLRKLAELASPDDRARILDGIEKEKKPFLFKPVPQVLSEYPSLLGGALGLEQLVGLLPAQKPVYYSIASSAVVSPKACRLLVSRVQITPQLGGLCSSFLNGLAPGAMVEGHVQSSTFRLPHDPSTPIIMVGVGSGLAPFLAFLEERALTNARNNTLFFGCMRPDQDFILRDDLEKWRNEGMVDLHVAFSHQTSETVFVQHLMLQQRERLWDLIEQGAHIYVCGHVRMGKGVDEAIRDILLYGCNNSFERATNLYDALYERQRLHADVFA